MLGKKRSPNAVQGRFQNCWIESPEYPGERIMVRNAMIETHAQGFPQALFALLFRPVFDVFEAGRSATEGRQGQE